MKNKKSARQHPGLVALRRVLTSMRWNDQGGYVSYRGKGKWDFISATLPPVSPKELNALFDLVGIVPDKIVPLGSCRNCAHAVNGRERGYVQPCSSCGRPRMTNFVQLRRK